MTNHNIKLEIKNYFGGISILRVISGTARGHKLKTPGGNATRPTSDRVKESLFNIIAQYIYDSEVLDLFSGTGSLGIEALSRGAASAVFIDISSECAGIIRHNLEHTKLIQKAEVLIGDVCATVQKLGFNGRKFDIIFMDPPYNRQFIQKTLNFIDSCGIIKQDGIIIAERHRDDMLPKSVGGLKLAREEKYGDTVLSFYKERGHTR
ncbi:MAG: 16S rRNA (guanine(966)-N(2))-methyltransferase RsmD [Clostridia bacterium]|nr:16S rRNA (guanine(966)-N(2))-methyltransferase RsmD [Clostridia bacterium]